MYLGTALQLVLEPGAFLPGFFIYRQIMLSAELRMSACRGRARRAKSSLIVARGLGYNQLETFVRITLPLAKQGILAATAFQLTLKRLDRLPNARVRRTAFSCLPG